MKAILLTILLSLSVSVFAEDVDPWRHQDVLIAAIKVGLSNDQQPKFRGAVTEFLQGYGADVNKILRGNDQTNLPRKINRKRNQRVKAMDKQMAGFLNEEQLPAYHVYRDTLLEKMDERAKQRRRRR